MSSLRQRISIGVVGITSTVVLVAAVGIWLATRAVLVGGVDRELHTRVERLRHFDATGPLMGRRRGPPPEAPRGEHPEAPRGDRPEPPREPLRFVQFVDAATRQELGRWPTSPTELGLTEDTLAGAVPGQPFSGRLSDGHHVRVLAVQLTHTPLAPRDDRIGPGEFRIIASSLPGEPRPPANAVPPALAAPAPPPALPITVPPIPAPSTPVAPAPAQPSSTQPAPVSPQTVTAPAAAPAPAVPGGPPAAPTEPAAPKPAAGPGALALAVADLEQIDEELTRMGSMLAVLWAVATLLAWVAVMLMRSTILRPVGELVAAIDRLGPDDLSARVPSTAGPDEVRGLTLRLNVLLDRLEQAFRHEQATIANVAHELRTPVTSLRMAIEFRLLAAPPAGEERQALASCLETVEHMQEMVANLLLLARLEAGKEPLQRQRLDLSALVAEVVEGWDARAGVRGQVLSATLPEHAPATTSDLHLRLIIGNLIGNAVAHGLPGREIDVTVATGPAGTRLTVGNPFAGAVDAQQLGKSFYRGDDARSGSDHCGLGLALCRRLARLLGGDLALSAADGRFEATLTLPEVDRTAD
jgi:signal transduction histidine kinase